MYRVRIRIKVKVRVKVYEKRFVTINDVTSDYAVFNRFSRHGKKIKHNAEDLKTYIKATLKY